MVEWAKTLWDLITSKVPHLGAKIFVAFILIYFLERLGVPFNNIFQHSSTIIIGILALTFPFAAWPIISWLRRNVKEHLVVQAKISKIEKYDRNKKTLLLLAFSTGENRIRLGNSVEIAELIADGVLEGYSFNFNVQYEVWNYLNAAPAKRDTILEHHDLIETVKHVIRKINDQKTYY